MCLLYMVEKFWGMMGQFPLLPMMCTLLNEHLYITIPNGPVCQSAQMGQSSGSAIVSTAGGEHIGQVSKEKYFIMSTSSHYDSHY